MLCMTHITGHSVCTGADTSTYAQTPSALSTDTHAHLLCPIWSTSIYTTVRWLSVSERSVSNFWAPHGLLHRGPHRRWLKLILPLSDLHSCTEVKSIISTNVFLGAFFKN